MSKEQNPYQVSLAEALAEGIIISDDKSRLDVGWIHASLSQDAYWASNRPLETVVRSIENSLCFGAYRDGRQVGFARVVTDYATFAWLCDVYVQPQERGRGVGKLLVQAVVSYPALRDLRRILLATRDAHELYHRYGGFEPLVHPERWMERFNTTGDR